MLIRPGERTGDAEPPVGVPIAHGVSVPDAGGKVTGVAVPRATTSNALLAVASCSPGLAIGRGSDVVEVQTVLGPLKNVADCVKKTERVGAV